MGVYYHGEEEADVSVYESNNYTYANKPDHQFMCRQCHSVLDTPYRKRQRFGCSLDQSLTRAQPARAEEQSDPLISLLPEPEFGPVCHTCWLRIAACIRNTWIPDEMMVHHLNQLVIVCTNRDKGCEKFFARGKLAVHLATECPFENVPCVYEKLGCSVQIQRRERRGHEQLCPLATHPELVLPILLRDVDCLSAIAVDVQRQSQVMNSWMDEVDDALRQLSSVNQSTSHQHPAAVLGLVDASNGDAAMDAYHARLFERTLTVPLKNGLPAFLDMRSKTIDLSNIDLAVPGILEVIDSISLNRCINSLSLNIFDPAIFTALSKTLSLNSTLVSLTVMVQSTADEPAILNIMHSIRSNMRTNLSQFSIIVSNVTSTDDMSQFSASILSKAKLSCCNVTCQQPGAA